MGYGHAPAYHNLTHTVAASAPGEVPVSDVVRSPARTSAGGEFEYRGEHMLKGIAEPQRLFAVRAWEACATRPPA